ncbi:Endonuclease/exonuclease/phosphatase [Fennellomyces sp. T-0311]|nr:Endonuclease/exonuclease/phosphatase [Fennellomyces sp. T-0311]
MKFMTFNIRLDLGGQAYAAAPSLSSQFQGELPWSVRKWKVGDAVLLWEPDIEPFYHQVVDLDAMLGDEYAWVGAGRDDGQKDGEFCPIFYKKDSSIVEDWHTIWLSETPDKPSRGWDAKHNRIATVARFKRCSDNSIFHVINTHFDHEGVESRQHAAQVILDHIKEYSDLVVLLGDLNSPESDGGYVTLTGGASQEDNGTWKNIDALNEKASLGVAIRTGKPVRTTDSMTLPTHRVIRPGQIMQNLKHRKDDFVDTRYALETRLTNHDARAPLSGPFGDYDTFTGFGDLPHSRIDYIMIKNHQKATVRRFGVLSNQFDDQLCISDHRPVVASIEW